MSDNEAEELARFLAVVERDLDAEAVELVAEPSEAPDRPSLSRQLPDGQWLVVTLAGSGADEALSERLDRLLDCFAQTLEGAAPGAPAPARPPVPEALHRELQDLAERARAEDAILVDARTEVTWCSARGGPALDATGRPLTEEALVAALRLRGPRLVEPGGGRGPGGRGSIVEAPAGLPDPSHRAAELVRAMPEMETLPPTGGTLRRSYREPGLGLLARSLGGIYALALVYDGSDFDEMLAERALAVALPRVERLLLALPPLDPSPEPRAAAVSLSGGRR